MCCMRLAEIQDAKNRQKFAIWAPLHNFVGLYLCNQGTHRQSEKVVKQPYLLHMSSQYGELQPIKAKFLYSILVADLQRAGIWPIIQLASSELARASRSATSLGPVCDQESVMEFGCRPVRSQIPVRYPGRRPGRRPVASWNSAYHVLSSSLAGLRRSATSLGPVCDQDSVMEFGFQRLRSV